MRTHNIDMESTTFQIAPMVDVIFILILFFMCSAGLIQIEKQLSITLPGTLKQTTAVSMPDEQMIEVMADGNVVVNGRVFDKPDSRAMPELIQLLKRYRASCEANRSPAMVTVSPAHEARYQRVVDVMDACAGASISNVTFSTGDEE